MPILDELQRSQAIEAMDRYLKAPPAEGGLTPLEESAELDRKRFELIESELGPLLRSFLDRSLPFAEFKSTIDGINKVNLLDSIERVRTVGRRGCSRHLDSRRNQETR